MTEDRPESLLGGNSNAPVRIGDHVHRVGGPWTPTVHAYLRHLRSRGVDLVPEPFGFDDEGREVLAFLPGSVPAYPLPEAVWTDAFLVRAAAVLRRLHDASADFDTAGAVWQQPTREPAQVISVNDFAPYNLVVDGDRIIGVIDLDQASPGPRVRDLAHLAYRLVPLTAPENVDGRSTPPEERGRRLRLLADAYGDVAPAAILVAVGPLLDDVAEHADRAGRPDHGALYRRDAEALPTVSAAILWAAG
ncbi:phosphotransferase [Amnibacterium kyonggiense]|uniref:Phosphotransferase family enzyme n=1 Tax=Amnibacterium kyonggiense TaxID=595671 RepID=A0A4R7FP91_9MICO|nr:phosphotransferase [Amnibacterium kyonggiense]TDS79542.1 phosphotransferase family enzyme [Amnibacterium kyonggiense]